jgi:hypothetical protein
MFKLHELCHNCDISQRVNVIHGILLASERRQIGVALTSFTDHNQNLHKILYSKLLERAFNGPI